MDFPKDAGLSCVRYFLEPFDPELEQYAGALLTTPSKVVGSLLCQCGSRTPLWGVYPHQNGMSAMASCHCNGSSLPIYIGAPPVLTFLALTPCPNGHAQGNPVAVAIGYPGEVPMLGTLDAERAQEFVIASRCVECRALFVSFQRALAAPPVITGEELWLARIQGIKGKELPRLIERAQDPNLSWSELELLIGRFPFEVLSNPVLSLLALEDPIGWQRLISRTNFHLLEEKMGEELRALSPEKQKLFAIDCVSRLLPKYEEENPEDLRPRQALSLARLVVEERASREALLRACFEVRQVSAPIRQAVEYAAHPELFDALLAIKKISAALGTWTMPAHQERVWQVARLTALLKGAD